MERFSPRRCEGFTLIETAAALALLLPLLLLAQGIFLKFHRQMALQWTRAEFGEIHRAIGQFLGEREGTPAQWEGLALRWRRDGEGRLRVEEVAPPQPDGPHALLGPVEGPSVLRCSIVLGDSRRTFLLPLGPRP